MKRNKIKGILIFLIIFAGAYTFADSVFLQNTQVSKERILIYPVPKDYRNYFFLQAFEDTTSIVIGDFVHDKKIISLIIDRGHDGKPDAVYDYYPQSGKLFNSEEIQVSFL